MSNRNKQKTKVKQEPQLRFYHFSQNNSGGRFVHDKESGLTASVYIQASSAEDANTIAEAKGIYFDGCEKDIDCDCCGDRWHPVSEHGWDAKERDPLLEKIVAKLKGEDGRSFDFLETGENACIHYADGTRKWF